MRCGLDLSLSFALAIISIGGPNDLVNAVDHPARLARVPPPRVELRLNGRVLGVGVLEHVQRVAVWVRVRVRVRVRG